MGPLGVTTNRGAVGIGPSAVLGPMLEDRQAAGLSTFAPPSCPVLVRAQIQPAVAESPGKRGLRGAKVGCYGARTS